MSKRKTKEEFIKESRNIHRDNYDYSKVEYKSGKTKVEIICKKHGEFHQSPYNHIRGHGCIKCATEKVHNKQRKTKEQFIKESKIPHGELYDYSKVEYKNGKSKVTILCRKHGEFHQSPINHIKGHGCDVCATRIKSKKYFNKKTHLYYVKIRRGNLVVYKIGITTQDIKNRFCREIKNNNIKIKILKDEVFELGKYAYEKEQNILLAYNQYLIHDLSLLKNGGNSELFSKDVLMLDN